jgi:hypothetical protein
MVPINSIPAANLAPSTQQTSNSITVTGLEVEKTSQLDDYSLSAKSGYHSDNLEQ